jgi:uncharacterized protein
LVIDTILIKVAGSCNLDCNYCYVYHGQDSGHKTLSSIMSKETISKVVDNLLELAETQNTGFAIVLHGGEPLLLGFEKLKFLISSLREKLDRDKYPISIQTNGILITNELLDMLYEFQTDLSISLDGSKNINDIGRVDKNGESSYNDVMKSINILDNHQYSKFLFSGTLSVIQPNTDPSEVYKFFKDIKAPTISFLLQDGNYDSLPKYKSDFFSTEYGKWIIGLINEYINDENPIPIKFLDNILTLAMGGESQKEGSGTTKFGIAVIETDGEIRKNDTLRTTFDGADFYKKRPTVFNTSLKDFVNSTEFIEANSEQTELPEECKNCEVANICGGGMLLTRYSSENGFNNPSIYCNDHKLYINHILDIVKNYND